MKWKDWEDLRKQNVRAEEFCTSPKIAELIGYLGAKLKPKKVLDPCCGLGSFISSLIEYLNQEPELIYGIEVNQSCAEKSAEYFKSIKNIKIQAANALTSNVLENNGPFDLIMCDAPYGARIVTDQGATSSDLFFLEKCLNTLAKGGSLFAVVPEGVLFRKDKKSSGVRRRILKDFDLLSIFSLPPGIVLPKTSIKVSILVIRNAAPKNNFITFGDFEKGIPDKESIYETVFKSREIVRPFFKIDRNLVEDEFPSRDLLPIDQRLDIQIPKNTHLSRILEIADILPISKLEDLNSASLILRRVGNFKIVSKDHLDKLSKSTLKNYSLIKLKDNVDGEYIKKVFEFEMLEKQLEHLARGSVVRTIVNEDAKNLLIPIPSVSEQKRVVELFTNIDESISQLKIIKDKLLRDPFSVEINSDKALLKGLEGFSTQAVSNTLANLPSPIAIAVRQTKNKVSGKESLQNSIALFETLLKFMVIILIMESYQKALFANIAEALGIPMFQPSTGGWLAIFRNITSGLGKIAASTDRTNDLIVNQLIVKAKEILKTIEDAKVISIRNDYLGHGSITIPEETYKIKNNEVKKVNDYLLSLMASVLQKYKLIQVLDYKKKNGKRFARIKNLTGENRDFLVEEIELPFEFDTDKVMLLREDCQNHLFLDPLIHFGVCTHCNSENLFFFDKRQKDNAEYFSYLHAHKTNFDLLGSLKNFLPLGDKK